MDEQYFDPKKRAEEKQAARDENQRKLDSGEITVEELRRKNGHFSSLAILPIDFSKIKHPK